MGAEYYNQVQQITPAPVTYRPLRWLAQWWGSPFSMEYPPNGQASSQRPTRKISWAEEPWATESTPLLDSNAIEPKDSRPVRQSVLKGSRSLSKIGSRHQEQLALPLYTTLVPIDSGSGSETDSEEDVYDYENDSDEGHDDSKRGMWTALAVMGILVILLLLSLGRFQASDPEIPVFPHQQANINSLSSHDPHHRAALIEAQNGAVATENELCSKIGVHTLKQGGNAADATVSSTLCIGVVNMFSSGLGGGGFMTIRIPPKSPGARSEVYTIDFREVAPEFSNSTMFKSNPMSSMFGGLSVAVPGEIKGLAELHRRWGKLPWKKVVEPSAKLARGWTVGPELDRRIRMHDLVMLYPDWQPIFAPNGKLLKEGDRISRMALSNTLQRIANEGPDSFYKGTIADALLNKIRETGGIMTQADLDNYEIRFQNALEGSYRNRTIYTTHAPTSGMVLLHMLNLVESIENFVEDGRTGLNTHRMVEAMKFGFAARTRVSDSMTKSDVDRMSEISSKKFADLVRRNLTDDRTHRPAYYNPTYDLDIDHGTSHGTIIDKDGMVVAITSSVNLVFGSTVLDPVTGIILNDSMDDFSKPGLPNHFGLRPSPFNYPAPGKRPLSSISPIIIENADGNVELALGGSGGSRIFPAIFQTILGVDWGLDISQAIEFPRLHDQLLPAIVDIDEGYPEEGIQSLRERTHNVTVLDIHRITSVVQGILVKNGTIFAASDSRKNGIAAGY